MGSSCFFISYREDKFGNPLNAFWPKRKIKLSLRFLERKKIENKIRIPEKMFFILRIISGKKI